MKSLKEFITENLEESTITTIQESNENENVNIEEAEKSTSENNTENTDK